MTQTAIRLKTKVLPGKRIEVTAPELPDDADVELIIMLPEEAAQMPEQSRPFDNVIDFLNSLPPGPRSASTWEEVERNFQEERSAWER